MAYEEVLRIGRKLEKIIQGTKSMDSAMDMLSALSELPISIDVLTKTRIGLTINDLRKKTTDERISRKAKNLIKDWKSLLEDKHGKGSSKAALPRIDSTPIILRDKECDKTSAQVSKERPMTGESSIKKRLLEDDIRNKCANMILDALLHQDLPCGSLNPEELAVQIEAKLFELHRGTTERYKTSVRSRVFNLRDKKNLELRENVLVGAVTVDKFASMTTNEMASDEMRKLREKFTKEGIDEHQIAVEEGTPSDMFTCIKCSRKNCTYTQVQTRSADEPMTTFVFCRDCGKRWKFC